MWMEGLGKEGQEGLTRKVSPTIQLGAELELENSKKAPMHCDSLTCASKKSAGEIVHDDPPNVTDTVTSVSQAAYTNEQIKSTNHIQPRLTG